MTSSGQEWQFHMSTDMQLSRMAIAHIYWHVVVNNGNFTLLLTSSGQELAISHSYWHLVGLSFLIRNKRALWRKSKTWNNELKFGRWTYFGWCPPPHSKLPEKRASSLHIYTINESPFETVNWWENDRLCPPPHETAREESKLFAYIYTINESTFETSTYKNI